MTASETNLPTAMHGPAKSNVKLVAEALRKGIVKGWLPPGGRIKELPLAEQLGVSRGPIREAIRLLEHDGLLQVIPNKGAIVPVPRSDDVLEVYALRAALGSLAVHKLMLDTPAPGTAGLDRDLTRFRRAVEQGKPQAAAEADLAYQTAVIACANLPRVARQFEQLTWQVRIFIGTMSIRYDDKMTLMLDEVSALHEAIVAHNATEAERLWREKFERWVRDTVGQLGESFDIELWAALTSGAVRDTTS